MLRVVERLFGRVSKVDRGQPGSPKRDVDSLDALIRAPGKACYATLTSLACQGTKDEFIELVHCPALVGSAIRDGDVATLDSQAFRGTNRTFVFLPSVRELFVEGATLEQCIFLLRKAPAGRTVPELRRFTIGRSKSNDLVMMDFAISRAHAELELTDAGFTLRDLGSSNGTRINGRLLKQDASIVRDRDILSFGRYEFQLLSPADLYDLLKSRVRS